LIQINRRGGVAVRSLDRDALYIRLWLIWLAILAVGIACVLFSVGAFSWP
jgi:hypothetical protein